MVSATAWAAFMPSGWSWVTAVTARASAFASSGEEAAQAQGLTRMAAPLPKL